MKAKELARILLQHPDVEVFVQSGDCEREPIDAGDLRWEEADAYCETHKCWIIDAAWCTKYS